MRYYEPDPRLPQRVHASLTYLHYCRCILEQTDASIPGGELTAAESRVKNAALRVLQQYFDGEMDFAEASPRSPRPPADDEEPGAPLQV